MTSNMARLARHPVLDRLVAATTGTSTVLVFGHRGSSFFELENSIPAFERARRTGVPAVELDVQLSGDGQVVVAHDGDLQRLAGRPERVRGLPAVELSRVALTKEGRSASGIPTLHAVLDVLARECVVDIELKSYRDTPAELSDQVAALIATRGIARRTMVSSFDPRLVHGFRRSAARHGVEVPTAAIYSRDPEVPWLLRGGLAGPLTGSEVAKPMWQIAGNRIHDRWNQSRPRVVWTVNDTVVAGAAIEAGAAGLVGDDPELLMEAVAQFSVQGDDRPLGRSRE
jgi:glycerophosphoryl diester phosphodiesterase